jgi:hypothetical protein
MSTQYIPRPLRNFAPDADPISDGVILDSNGVYPTDRGFRTLPVPTAASDPLPDPCLGAYVTQVEAGTVIVAGTVDDLYVYSAGSWTAQGLTCGPVTGKWRFTTYGNFIIAVNGVDRPFASNNGATFVALGGTPPISSLCAASDYSLFLGQVGTNTWWSSLSASVWTPSSATITVTADVEGIPGVLTSMIGVKGAMAMFKRQGCVVATYTQSPPYFWDVRKVSAEVGTPNQLSAISVKDRIWFLGPDDFYMLDGYDLIPIPNQLKEWFFRESYDVSYDYLVEARHDEPRNLIFWHYPSKNSGGVLNKYVCLNYRTGNWAFGSLTIQCVLQGSVPASTGLTYDEFGDMFATYDDIPDVPYDWPVFGSNGQDLPGYFDTTDILNLYSEGTPGPDSDAFVTSGFFGDRRNLYQAIRIRPGFVLYPENSDADPVSEVTPQTTYLQGAPVTDGTAIPLSEDGFYNINVTARMQRHKFNFYAEAEIVDYELEVSPAGEV